MFESAPPPRSLNPALPEDCDDVFARGLAKDRAARFATAGELVEALDGALADVVTAALPGPAMFDAASRAPVAAIADDTRTLHWPLAEMMPSLARRPVSPSTALLGAAAVALSALGLAVLRHDSQAAVTSRPAPSSTASMTTTPKPDTAVDAAVVLRRASSVRRAVRPVGLRVVEGQLVQLGHDVTVRRTRSWLGSQ
jgi:hypothetical protein